MKKFETIDDLIDFLVAEAPYLHLDQKRTEKERALGAESHHKKSA